MGSSNESSQKTAAQKVAEYEADKKPIKYSSMTDLETGITLRICSLGDVPLQPSMGRL